jgi:acyl-homoserine lactone acylase PvdQ
VPAPRLELVKDWRTNRVFSLYMGKRLRRRATQVVVIGCVLAAALTPAAAGAGSNPGHYRDGEYDQVRNILPPGQTGFVSAADFAHHNLDNSYYAPHQADQLGMYADLVNKAPNITPADLNADYKDASFGVPADQIASTESPPGHPGLTIIRDKQFGVPHIYGTTDDDVVYGTGWVLAEDRLFMTDVLRHYGRSRLASFLGPDRSFIQMDCDQAQLTGYTEAELDQQVAQLKVPFPHLAQVYVDGINAYIDAATTNPTLMPAEYPTAAAGLPQHFNIGDIIAIAGLVGGIFGKGGGVETRNAKFLRGLFAAYGGPTNSGNHNPATALKIFHDFMENEDPAAPTTLDQPFPYETKTNPQGPGVAVTASPPPNSTAPGGTCTFSPTVPHGGSVAAGGGAAAAAIKNLVNLQFPTSMSNALLVDAAHSTTGRPIAVMGPQVAYFSPEILMEEDLHGPSYDVRGVSFPGTNFIVELGHGPDYAWSATSAGTDNVDQFVERLCNPAAANPLTNVSPDSTHYMHNGQCVAMYERTDSENAPIAAGSNACLSKPPTDPGFCPPGTVTVKIERTVHGPVLGRTTALAGGVEVPVAIASQRSTFLHEADSIMGFAAFNNPAQLRDAGDFLNAASQINYTFNWFYADNQDIAYYQSGLLPIRPSGVDPDLPTWGTGQWDWAGWLSFAGHPHAINPPRGWMTSWNNKGAPQFRASDDQWAYGQVFRSQSLDAEIRGYLSRQGGKMSLLDLDNAMESAATVDLWGTQVLPYALQVIGNDPSVAPQVNTLQQWLTLGTHRRDRSGSGVYEQIGAIKLMDAWYPRMLHAIFNPAHIGVPCGGANAAGAAVPPELCDDSPGPLGSAYIEGWYGYTQKALQMALGLHVAQPYSLSYCGAGSLSTCRQELITSLKAAATAASGASDSATTSADDIKFSGVGLFGPGENGIPWQNRPTFQQVVDIPTHRPRSPGLGVPQMTPAVALGVVGAPLGLLALPRRRQQRPHP